MSQALFLVALIAIGTSSSLAMTQAEKGPSGQVQIQLTLGNVKPLKAVLRIAEENRIPLGIVFGSQPILCSQERPTRINANGYLEAFSQAVSGTGYTITRDGDRYVLSAPDLTPHEKEVLNYRFDRFSATDTTMNDAGQLLTGYINTTIEGARGFVTGPPIGSRTDIFTIRLQSTTTLEIANRIVSQDGKGIWVFHSESETAPIPRSRSVIRIYSYDQDATILEGLSCGGDALPDR